MSGSNIASESSVMRELVAAFGEERARQIMGDTTPPRRRAQVPMRVGERERARPAISRTRSSEPSLRDLQDFDREEGVPNRVLAVHVRTHANPIPCAKCGRRVPPDTEVMKIIRVVGHGFYCTDCGPQVAGR